MQTSFTEMWVKTLLKLTLLIALNVKVYELAATCRHKHNNCILCSVVDNFKGLHSVILYLHLYSMLCPRALPNDSIVKLILA